MESKKNNNNLLTKQKQTQKHRKQTYGYQREKEWRKNIGAWDYHIYTATHKIRKQLEPTV